MAQSKAFGNAVKLRDVVNVKDPAFGAKGDGVTDDSAAIQAAIDSITTTGVVVFPKSIKYICNSGLSIDTNKVSIDLQGAVLDFSAMASGVGFTITNSNADPNARVAFNHAHPIQNGYILGAAPSNVNITAVRIVDGAGVAINGVTFKNIAFVGWGKDVMLGTGASMELFDHCQFTVTTGSGAPTTWSINIPTSTNSGERNTFRNCIWNNRDYVCQQANVNADTIFNDCSFDYMASRVMEITGGKVTLNTPHIEQDSDANYWFYVSGTNSMLTLRDPQIIEQAAKTAFQPFAVDAGATQGGISIQGGFYSSAVGSTVQLIGGTGITNVKGLRFLGSRPVPALGIAQNYLAYGEFEDADYTGEWTLTAGAVRSNAQAHAGTWSLSLPGTAATSPQAVMTMPCEPGQVVMGELWYMTGAITGTSGTFAIQLDWLDKNNVSLGANALVTKTTNTAWTRTTINFATPAPKGTVNYRILASLIGAVGAELPIAYIDDVLVSAV